MSPQRSEEAQASVRSLADVLRLETTAWREAIPATNTYALLRAACKRYSDRPALRLLLGAVPDAPTRDINYSQLLDNIHRTGNALHSLGVRPGVPVAILLPNLVEGHFALWGAQAAGIASPINPMLEEAYIARICTETRAKVLIALGPAPGLDIWAKAVAVADQVGTVETILQVDFDTAMGRRDDEDGRAPVGPMPRRLGLRVIDFHTALAAAESTALTTDRTFDEIESCAYFHTGGTTGYPKIAVHSHLNETFLAWALGAEFGPDNIVLGGLPLFHVNGAMVTGLSAFHCGFQVVMLTPGGYRTPGVLDHFWALADRFGATTFSAVPTILTALASRPFPGKGVPTLRHVICGAAPLPRQVAKNFETVTGLHIHEGYGLTEGTCVSTVNPPEGERRLGTVGIRLPWQDLRLFHVDANKRVVGEAQPGTIGVVAIRGPNVFPGYLRSADNEGIWLSEGWFNTGDLGRMDEQGYLTLCGRAKDLIIRGGHNIDPAMIEEALCKHPAVAMAAALGQPDQHAGELPVAYVTLKPGVDADAAMLQAHAALTVPERAAVPVRIEILPDLPLTAVGKISKPSLRLRAVEHVLNESLAAQAMSSIHVSPYLCPDRGIVVRLHGPDEMRTAAFMHVGLYSVVAEWSGTSS